MKLKKVLSAAFALALLASAVLFIGSKTSTVYAGPDDDDPDIEITDETGNDFNIWSFKPNTSGK